MVSVNGVFKNTLLVTLILLSFASCNKAEFDEVSEYYNYVNDPKNELIFTKSNNGFKISLKYFPPEISILNDLDNNPLLLNKIDSLKGEYSNSMCFYFSIAPEDHNNIRDIHLWNISRKSEFEERQQFINFQLGKYFKIISNNKNIEPTLFTVESHPGISKSINGLLVYSRDNFNSFFDNKKIKIVFTDPIFNTGETHFFFDKNNLKAIPELKISNSYEN